MIPDRIATERQFEKRRDTAARDVSLAVVGIIVLIFLAIGFLFLMVLTAGCVDQAKTTALDAVSPVVVLKGSTQYQKMMADQNQTNQTLNQSNVSTVTVITENITTIPTTDIPTFKTPEVHYLDPFSGGERYEGQWYRWTWPNASGYQTADRGIVIYRHIWLNDYTYHDDAWGQNIMQVPDQGYKFLAVYAHEEDFSPDNSGIWGYDNTSFNLQYNQQFHQQYNFEEVYRIVDLEDTHYDYYKIDRAIPFGMTRVYGGLEDASTGGYHAEQYQSLWSGKGNSWDGYLLYEVPVSLTDSDIRIVGNFAGKDVNWRFDNQPTDIYPSTTEHVAIVTMSPVPTSAVKLV